MKKTVTKTKKDSKKDSKKKETKKEQKVKKEKKPKEPIEDHSSYKVEVYDMDGQKRVYNFDWQGNLE